MIYELMTILTMITPLVMIYLISMLVSSFSFKWTSEFGVRSISLGIIIISSITSINNFLFGPFIFSESIYYPFALTSLYFFFTFNKNEQTEKFAFFIVLLSSLFLVVEKSISVREFLFYFVFIFGFNILSFFRIFRLRSA